MRQRQSMRPSLLPLPAALDTKMPPKEKDAANKDNNIEDKKMSPSEKMSRSAGNNGGGKWRDDHAVVLTVQPLQEAAIVPMVVILCLDRTRHLYWTAYPDGVQIETCG